MEHEGMLSSMCREYHHPHAGGMSSGISLDGSGLDPHTAELASARLYNLQQQLNQLMMAQQMRGDLGGSMGFDSSGIFSPETGGLGGMSQTPMDVDPDTQALLAQLLGDQDGSLGMLSGDPLAALSSLVGPGPMSDHSTNGINPSILQMQNSAISTPPGCFTVGVPPPVNVNVPMAHMMTPNTSPMPFAQTGPGGQPNVPHGNLFWNLRAKIGACLTPRAAPIPIKCKSGGPPAPPLPPPPEEKKESDSEKFDDAAAKKQRRRRSFKELVRDIQCRHDGCNRVYATESSLQTHIRLKHGNIRPPGEPPIRTRLRRMKKSFSGSNLSAIGSTGSMQEFAMGMKGGDDKTPTGFGFGGLQSNDSILIRRPRANTMPGMYGNRASGSDSSMTPGGMGGLDPRNSESLPPLGSSSSSASLSAMSDFGNFTEFSGMAKQEEMEMMRRGYNSANNLQMMSGNNVLGSRSFPAVESDFRTRGMDGGIRNNVSWLSIGEEEEEDDEGYIFDENMAGGAFGETPAMNRGVVRMEDDGDSEPLPLDGLEIEWDANELASICSDVDAVISACQQ
eukprot:comp20866_c0_seq1/m.27656 comp20866_c0_seq1/g.27656  ORF comp20866_c0_seq1/g.27656 comp20866_c0_seq1/m.27656 type:complete len:563 (-) comp20866_c0_seq1:39-1727(-)